jgi:hypothetical protein
VIGFWILDFATEITRRELRLFTKQDFGLRIETKSLPPIPHPSPLSPSPQLATYVIIYITHPEDEYCQVKDFELDRSDFSLVE